jgi:hypothetical protein
MTTLAPIWSVATSAGRTVGDVRPQLLKQEKDKKNEFGIPNGNNSYR